MTAPLIQLDHLVVSARTLEEGVEYVAAALGVTPSGGGAHALMRTHNRLVGLWGGVYLEVIAIDPDARGEGRPRWFALDDEAVAARLAKGPYLSHWVARVERPRSLTRWQTQYPARIAPGMAMSRGELSWTLTVPADGAFPCWQGAGDGVLPSLIQWDTARHPAALLPETGIALKKLQGWHPQAALLAEQLAWLGAAHLIDLQPTDGTPTLAAEFETPDGPRTLGGLPTLAEPEPSAARPARAARSRKAAASATPSPDTETHEST